MPSRTFLFLGLALGGSALAAPETPERIELSFDWSEAFEVQVTGTRTVARRAIGTPPQEATFSVDHRIRAEPTDRGVALSVTPDLVAQGTGMTADLEDRQRASLLAEYGQVGLAANRRAAWQGLHPPEEAATALAASVAPDNPVFGAHLAGLAGQASERQWAEMVGYWDRLRFRPGASYGTRGRATVLGLGHIEVFREFTLVERVACHAADEDLGCVELRMREYPNQMALEETLADWGREIAGGQRGGPSPLLEHDLVVTVVTEPDTLKPHRLTRAQATLVEFTDAQGQPIRGETRDDLTLDFAY